MTSPDRLADQPAWPPPAYQPRWGDLPALAWLMARAGRRDGWSAAALAVGALPFAVGSVVLLHLTGQLAHLDREAMIGAGGNAVLVRRRRKLWAATVVTGLFVAGLAPFLVAGELVGRWVDSEWTGVVVVAVIVVLALVAAAVKFNLFRVVRRRRAKPVPANGVALELGALFGAGKSSTVRLGLEIVEDAAARGWEIHVAPANPRLERVYRRWGFASVAGGWMTHPPG